MKIIMIRESCFFSVLKMLIVVCWVSVSFADQADTRADLQHILQSVDHVERLIHQAAEHQDLHQRIQFQFQALLRDLQIIKKGIDAYFQYPESAFNFIPEIEGDYITWTVEGQYD